MKKMIALVLSVLFVLGCTACAEMLSVGTNPEFAPFEYVGDDGAITGIDADIIQAIAVELGYEGAEIQAMDFDALIPALVSGKIDCCIAGMTITEERKQSVLFSDPYYNAGQVIIVPAENASVASAADLGGKKIGVQLGTTGDLYVTETYPDADVQRFTKAVDAVVDVANGRLDAVVLDAAPAKVYSGNTAGTAILDEVLSDEQYGIAMRLEDTELQANINAALAKLTEDGTIGEIIAKYDTAE